MMHPWTDRLARFAIADDEHHTLLGQIAFWLEESGGRALAGFWVLPSQRQHGVATTALKLLCSWAFGLPGLERMGLLINLDNSASQRVATKCGFTREGILRGYEEARGARQDLISYSILRTDISRTHR